MLDDIREWISDNLRYMMLIGAILLVVLALFFGVRACIGGKDKKDDEQQTTEQQNQEEEPGDEPVEEEPEITNPLVKDEGKIAELLTNYYKALGEKDIETLQTLLTVLSPSDEAKITNVDYIEGYEMGDVYTKKGLDDKSYVVFACYNYLCSDIDTPVPAMSQVYVVEDEEGKVLIDGSENVDTEISEYMDKLLKDSDVKVLVAEVQTAYDEAQEKDAALAEFLAGLGDESNGASDAETGTVLTVTEGCNVRAEASSDGDIIGGYDAGTEIEKLGQDGEWVQIEYEGQTGYIHSSLLEE